MSTKMTPKQIKEQEAEEADRRNVAEAMEFNATKRGLDSPN